MPSAVRLSDTTSLGGAIVGPGVSTVLIGGLPASILGDNHAHPNGASPIVIGSTSVMIGGKPAARVGDTCAMGGSAILGLPTVQIG